jgi:hypothetical protein
MADDVFRQSRKKITPDEVSDNENNPLESVKQVQQAIAKETGKEVVKPFDSAPFEISGNVPPEFRAAMQKRAQQGPPELQPVQAPTPPNVKTTRQGDDDEGFDSFEAPPDKPRAQVKANKKAQATPDRQAVRVQGSDQLEDLLQKLAEHHQWEKFEFPSKGKFYANIPGEVHIRAMTGEEEQILATPRWVKKGKAIDMIFRRCIKEPIDTELLLSVDRTHLLIFLRGISYTPEYDVEIKCPNCQMKFAHVIELNDLDVNLCPEDYGPEKLSGTLPASGFKYNFRLATGADEQEIAAYRERRISQWGDQGDDDTLLYRTALLLEDIEGVTMKKELALLLKKLPIQDVAHLRNEINQPPFGVDTTLPILCPSCMEEFKIDLPLETNFFFPKKKEERTRA